MLAPQPFLLRAGWGNRLSKSPPPTRGGRPAKRAWPRRQRGGGGGQAGEARGRRRGVGGGDAASGKTPPTRNCSRSSLAISASPRWGRRFASCDAGAISDIIRRL